MHVQAHHDAHRRLSAVADGIALAKSINATVTAVSRGPLVSESARALVTHWSFVGSLWRARDHAAVGERGFDPEDHVIGRGPPGKGAIGDLTATVPGRAQAS
jgi:hypothetical protein